METYKPILDACCGGTFTDKSPTLSANAWEHNNLLITEDETVRRITPVEAARLQTIPDLTWDSDPIEVELTIKIKKK